MYCVIVYHNYCVLHAYGAPNEIPMFTNVNAIINHAETIECEEGN